MSEIEDVFERFTDAIVLGEVSADEPDIIRVEGEMITATFTMAFNDDDVRLDELLPGTVTDLNE